MTRIALLLLLSWWMTPLLAQQTETIYLDSTDQSANLYVVVYPEQLPYKGVLFLIPGFAERPKHVLSETDLPKYAAQQGLLTVIPTFKTGVTSFGIDNATQQSFREILEHVVFKFHLSPFKFYIGGFSIGGSCALRFAELANQDDYQYKPTAVFAIDPPLDFERLYHSYKRNVRLAVKTRPNFESVYMIGRIEQEMGGSPEQARANYYQYSPYSFSDTTQTAIKSLLQTPIRIYTEPDINWWLTERGSDYSAINALDASCMMNELNRLGNKKACLITTQGKGFRKENNMRHPHSWNIVEAAELVEWLFLQQRP
ncbi:MAG: alpha/beta hydrolase [Saprospiraceae bacterium]